jgi:hypothetical protein
MRLRLTCVWPSALLLASASAFAAGPLTSQECHSYPFVPTNGPITHQDLIRELALLESVGYQPVGDDVYYPFDIRSAMQRLHAKYLAECQQTTPS